MFLDKQPDNALHLLEKIEMADAILVGAAAGMSAACGFDFWEVYGELGEGYIQIHHEEPLFLYEEEGIEDILRDALQRVKPLCANCHCMIHRWRDAPLSVEELRALIRQRS